MTFSTAAVPYRWPEHFGVGCEQRVRVRRGECTVAVSAVSSSTT